jgi:hypothetical protein
MTQYQEQWVKIGNGYYHFPYGQDSDDEKEGGRVDIKSTLKKVGRVARLVAPVLTNPAVGIVSAVGKLQKRKYGVLPPPVRELLSRVGSESITKMVVVRTPLSGAIKTLLNVISLGAYETAVRQSPYDQMFHLALYVNDRYTIDKQAVIKFVEGSPVQKNSESMEVPLVSRTITLTELFEKTRQAMGDRRFSNYDARTNNCQSFILGMLRGNNLLNSDLQQFIQQDADVIFRKMPSLSQKIGRFFTDVGAVADQIIEGQGTQKYVMHKNGDCFTITSMNTGRVVDYCLMDERQAQAKLDALNYDDPRDEIKKDEALSEKKKKKTLSDNKKKNKKISPKKRTMKTWRQFWSEACKGKKFESRKAVNDYMREMAKKYKEMKAK